MNWDELPILSLIKIKCKYCKQYIDKIVTTAYSWCDGHSTSIGACGVWGVRAGVQVSKRELHTHIHLDYANV